jgi:ATP synthase protein I
MDNNKLPQKEDIDVHQKFRQQVELKEIRKLRSRRRKNRAIWFGLGMFGIIGWSVAIPTIIGVALGVWIDAKWPSRFSWTLMLLVGGLIVGCLNAWYWVKKEYKEEE